MGIKKNIFTSKKNNSQADQEGGETPYLFVGLGNPGVKYARTWHNCGFIAIDYLANHYGIKVNKVRFKGVYGQGQIEGRKVYLLKPETYMNNSGESVREAMDYFKIPLDHVVIFYDDVDFNVGQMRIREKGGPGTHNGMKSVVQHVGGNTFPRFRIGIGPQPKEQDIISYVLAAIPDQAKPALEQVMKRIVEAVSYLVTSDIQMAMNRININNNNNHNGKAKPQAEDEA